MHRTTGSLRVFRRFAQLEQFPVSEPGSHSAQPPVTLAVRPLVDFFLCAFCFNDLVLLIWGLNPLFILWSAGLSLPFGGFSG